MKQTAKILKFKNKNLESIEDVRAALIAVFEDVESGDATVAEATPIKKEIKSLMREIRAQMKNAKAEDKAALKSFFGK